MMWKGRRESKGSKKRAKRGANVLYVGALCWPLMIHFVFSLGWFAPSHGRDSVEVVYDV